jgi:hypothetical protein
MDVSGTVSLGDLGESAVAEQNAAEVGEGLFRSQAGPASTIQ